MSEVAIECSCHREPFSTESVVPLIIPATKHIHPSNPDAIVLGHRLEHGDRVTRDVVFAAPDGSWRPVQSGIVGLELGPNARSLFVRPVQTQTIEAVTEGEIEAVRLMAETATSAMRKLMLGLFGKLRAASSAPAGATGGAS